MKKPEEGYNKGTYTFTQQVFCLSWATSLSFNKKGTAEEIAAETRAEIERVLAKPDVRKLIGVWNLAWGPAVYADSFIGEPEAVNSMFIAVPEEHPDEAVVALAGTNGSSLVTWVLQNFNVKTKVPWPYGKSPLKPHLSKGLSIALDNTVRLKSSFGSDGPPETARAFLANGNFSKVMVTGHSLAGAISPCYALYLDETRAQWDPDRSIELRCLPTAGQTPGDTGFSTYYDRRLGRVTERVWNQLDVVPHAFNSATLEEVPGLYGPELHSNFVTKFVRSIQRQTASLCYLNVRPQVPGFPSKIYSLESLIEAEHGASAELTALKNELERVMSDSLSSPLTTAAYIVQALIQHTIAYIAHFDITQFAEYMSAASTHAMCGVKDAETFASQFKDSAKACDIEPLVLDLGARSEESLEEMKEGHGELLSSVLAKVGELEKSGVEAGCQKLLFLVENGGAFPRPTCKLQDGAAQKKAVAGPLGAYLESVKNAVSELRGPDGQPVEIPDYKVLETACRRIDQAKHPNETAVVVNKLLGRGLSHDMDVPGKKLKFPADHHLHPKMGAEWYYLAANLEVQDAQGKRRRLGVMTWIQKNRVVGNSVQAQAGWSDHECIVAASKATVVMDTVSPGENRTLHVNENAQGASKSGGSYGCKPGEHPHSERSSQAAARKIVRRTRNLQWALKGGNVEFSQPGEDFMFRCGADSFSGSSDVLPLRVQVEDGEQLRLDLTADCVEGLTAPKAFFLRGKGGTGVTQVPTPGLVYGWPQVQVSGSLVVEGETFEVVSGTGWIDHQVLMGSLENPKRAAAPVPFIDDPQPYVGWCWMFANLDSKSYDTFCYEALFLPLPSTSLLYPSGYYATVKDGAWQVELLNSKASMSVGDWQLLPTSNRSGASYASTLVPNSWKLRQVKNEKWSRVLEGDVLAWSGDGTFQAEDLVLWGEMPVDFVASGDEIPGGTGFCETVGYENTLAYRARAIKFLKSGILT